MKLVAISRILDEADIIEAFVRHTAAYAQHHIILDNGSTDGTLEILHELRNEGFNLTVYQNKSVSFSEQAFMTFMYKEAVTEHGADWVACLDGDEFIDDRLLVGGLCNYLANLKGTACVKLPWTHYDYTSRDDPNEIIVPVRVTNRSSVTEIYKVIVSASIDHENVVIDNGGHDILVSGRYPSDSPILSEVRLAHFSERSAFQTIVKYTRGWMKVKAAGQGLANQGISVHYKAPFEALKNKPGELLRNEWYMTRKNERDDHIVDPIDYRGGPLKYTAKFDAAMLAVRCLAGYMEALADRHGELVDTFPSVKALIEEKNRIHEKIL